MQLRVRPPFNLSRTLRFILSPPALANGRSFEPLLDYLQAGEYRRVVDLNGDLVLYGVSQEPAGNALYIKILAGPGDVAMQRAIRETVARQFSAELDLVPFYRQADDDPVLSQLVARFRGMRIPQAPTVYETLVSAILEQQVNLSFAHQVKRALIATYGRRIEFQNQTYNAFPQPTALARTTPTQLRQLQISGPKARYIIGISRAGAEGRLDAEGLRALEPAEALARLREFKGVGPWTAHYVGLRALGQQDCLPAADVGLQKAIQFFYGLRKTPSGPQVEKIARRWQGWRSYGTFYLWLTSWKAASWRKELRQEILRTQQGGFR